MFHHTCVKAVPGGACAVALWLPSVDAAPGATALGWAGPKLQPCRRSISWMAASNTSSYESWVYQEMVGVKSVALLGAEDSVAVQAEAI